VYSCIVVGTDGSETAQRAVSAAADLARLAGASLEIVSAYSPRPAVHGEMFAVPDDAWVVNAREVVEATLADAVERLQGSGLAVTTYTHEGDPADAILDVAEERGADLIVVGNKGMTGARRFLLGSVPNKVSHHAPCSVLIVRTT
jgi:nucleotide-binding universal stress UspA family protein